MPDELTHQKRLACWNHQAALIFEGWAKAEPKPYRQFAQALYRLIPPFYGRVDLLDSFVVVLGFALAYFWADPSGIYFWN